MQMAQVILLSCKRSDGSDVFASTGASSVSFCCELDEAFSGIFESVESPKPSCSFSVTNDVATAVFRCSLPPSISKRLPLHTSLSAGKLVSCRIVRFLYGFDYHDSAGDEMRNTL